MGYAGWTPDKLEELFTESFPCWRQAPYGAVTGLIAAWTLHRVLVASRTPRPTRTPSLRAAGLAWVKHRLCQR
jgi:hypothetical protein